MDNKPFFIRQTEAYTNGIDEHGLPRPAVFKHRLTKFYATREEAVNAFRKAPKKSYYRYETNFGK